MKITRLFKLRASIFSLGKTFPIPFIYVNFEFENSMFQNV